MSSLIGQGTCAAAANSLPDFDHNYNDRITGSGIVAIDLDAPALSVWTVTQTDRCHEAESVTVMRMRRILIRSRRREPLSKDRFHEPRVTEH